MISIVRYALFAFAVFLVVGGILGFAEKHSVMSLLGGGVCAILAVAGGMQLPAKPKIGLILGIVAALVAEMRPLMTLSKGLALWPGGALLGASVVVELLCVAALIPLLRAERK